MTWMKRALFIGIGVIALSTFIKILHRKGSPALIPSSTQTQIFPTPSPSEKQVQQINDVAPVELKKEQLRRSIVPKRFGGFVRRAFRTVLNVLNGLVAVILFLIALLLVLPCLYFFPKFSFVPKVPREFTDSQTLSNQIQLISHPQNDVPPSDTPFPQPYASLDLSIQQIKNDTPTTATLTGTLYLTFSYYYIGSICDSSAPSTRADKQRCDKGSPITLETNNEDFRLKPQYDGVSIVLTVYSLNGTFSQELPIEQFFSPESPLSIALPLKLSLETQASTYPEDWYQLNPFVDIRFSLPSLYEYFAYNPSRTDFHFIPAVVGGSLDSSLNNMTLVFAPPGWIYPLSGDGDIYLDILIQRNMYSKALIYLATAFLPFALLLLFSHAIMTAARKEKELVTNASLNILIMMLTFIAIRQVFVPPDIQGGLTRIDYLLIIFGTILLAVIFFTYATTITRNIFEKKKEQLSQ